VVWMMLRCGVDSVVMWVVSCDGVDYTVWVMSCAVVVGVMSFCVGSDFCVGSAFIVLIVLLCW